MNGKKIKHGADYYKVRFKFFAESSRRRTVPGVYSDIFSALYN